MSKPTGNVIVPEQVVMNTVQIYCGGSLQLITVSMYVFPRVFKTAFEVYRKIEIRHGLFWVI